MMDKTTPQGKGIRTAYQAIAGAVVAYFTGLLAIPEVRDYTVGFVQNEGLATLGVVLVSFGLGAGLVSFVQNRLGR
jgi:hypothetical protein